MTNEQVIQWASKVDPNDRISPSEARRLVISELLQVCKPTQKQKDQVIKNLKRVAEAFQRASQPGHEVWYPRHLQVAAKAIEMFDSNRRVVLNDTEFSDEKLPKDYPWLVWIRGDDGIFRTHGHGFATKDEATKFIFAEVGTAWRLEHWPSSDIVDECN